ncbi:MAG: hypothetical protein Q4D16_00460 [Eubacteriales bacterium]|nr:hypothetical protein [Eubacteriales bacterium]
MSEILFVNGHVNPYQRFCRHLSRSGHTCNPVDDGIEAAVVLRKNHYDAVVFGIEDPIKDKKCLCEMLKLQKDIMVIILGKEIGGHDPLAGQRCQ